MNCIAITGVGIETVFEKDLKRLTPASSMTKTIPGACLFESTKEDLAKMAYMCQSIERIGPIIYSKSHDCTLESIVLPKDAFTNFFSFSKKKFSEMTIAIRATVAEGLDFRSVDVVMTLSDALRTALDTKMTYKDIDADAVLGIYVTADFYVVYVELCAKELSKRDYKVFSNKTSLRGTVAYAFATFCPIKDGELILDPFCRSGEIGIELAHARINKSIHFYHKDKFLLASAGIDVSLESFDTDIKPTPGITIFATDSAMPNVRAAEKNSKIGGVNKLLSFSRLTIEDLDLKFSKNVDHIITQLPRLSSEKYEMIIKWYEQLFKQTKLISKPGSSIYCIGGKIDAVADIAPEYKCTLVDKYTLMQGQEDFSIYHFVL